MIKSNKKLAHLIASDTKVKLKVKISPLKYKNDLMYDHNILITIKTRYQKGLATSDSEVILEREGFSSTIKI